MNEIRYYVVGQGIVNVERVTIALFNNNTIGQYGGVWHDKPVRQIIFNTESNLAIYLSFGRCSSHIVLTRP